MLRQFCTIMTDQPRSMAAKLQKMVPTCGQKNNVSIIETAFLLHSMIETT